jgi:quercetin dioxygenase-like cupin family protein
MISLLAGCLCAGGAHATHGVEATTLLQTTASWDGTPYRAYPDGQPQVTVLRIVVPPHSTLAWHRHPMINAAYVLSGSLTVEEKNEGRRQHLGAGDVLPEMVDRTHRGFTGEQAATLIVFYAGAVGMPLSVEAH